MIEITNTEVMGWQHAIRGMRNPLNSWKMSDSADGKIGEITKWLNEKIHRYGSTRTPEEMIDAVCHKPVSAEPLIRYFKKKYTEVYDL